ncbi:hypothetical protein GR702_09980 [Novosphingobium sp. FGD1]|uniref:Uncharacterized protein n=1 Tax=Novosphingobium silvae TaxID=2692619 RepID=A0A7X4GG96_9SPHN|nr:hypothetical protein [Novosphingobium silvae]MYL98098.1 hypothetical protein [Novosphingobium silvae]
MGKTIVIAAAVSFLGAVLVSLAAGMDRTPQLGSIAARAAPAAGPAVAR